MNALKRRWNPIRNKGLISSGGQGPEPDRQAPPGQPFKGLLRILVSRLRNSLKKFSGLILSPSPLPPPIEGGET